MSRIESSDQYDTDHRQILEFTNAELDRHPAVGCTTDGILPTAAGDHWTVRNVLRLLAAMQRIVPELAFPLSP